MTAMSTVKTFALVAVLATAALPGALSGSARPVPDGIQGEGDPIGTWRLTVTGPNNSQFHSLIMFHQDGTITERNSFNIGESTGAGVWSRLPGRRFAVTTEQFVDTDNDGWFDARYQVRLTFLLTGPDTMMGTAGFDIRTLDGTTVLAGPFQGFAVDATRMTTTLQ